uniref:adenine phosphoribosyltransferase n=1 Tax=Heterorhabditis bacteriophora TaxID=37862 RepID=A0A1I7WVI1_HETBA
MSKLDQIRPRVEKYIRSVIDFPRKGVNFRDITPMFAHPDLIKDLCDAIADHVRSDLGPIDAVAGIEARGQHYHCINICKSIYIILTHIINTIIQAPQDTVEIQKDSFAHGSKILIVDDLLATGGTLTAAIEVLKKAGGIIAEAFLLIELKPLNGRNAIQDTTVTALIQYDEA